MGPCSLFLPTDMLKIRTLENYYFLYLFFFLHKIEMVVLPCGSSEPLPLCSWHTLPFSLGVGHIALQGDLRQSCSLLNIRLENIGDIIIISWYYGKKVH